LGAAFALRRPWHAGCLHRSCPASSQASW
jgi:hypothetical protein